MYEQEQTTADSEWILRLHPINIQSWSRGLGILFKADDKAVTFDWVVFLGLLFFQLHSVYTLVLCTNT